MQGIIQHQAFVKKRSNISHRKCVGLRLDTMMSKTDKRTIKSWLQVACYAHRHNSSHVTLTQMHAPQEDCARKATIASKGSPDVASIVH